MTYCPGCGNEVQVDASFCESCGTELDTGDKQSANESTESVPTGDPAGGTQADAEVTGSTVEDGSTDGIRWAYVGLAGFLALLPAFGAYMMVSIAADDVVGLVFLVSLPVFGYLIYQRPTPKSMLGGMSFWLAVEAFLSPVVMLIYTAVFTAQETTTEAGQAGAAIGGTFLMIIAFVVGLPVGIVLYIVSRKLDVDESPQATAA